MLKTLLAFLRALPETLEKLMSLATDIKDAVQNLKREVAETAAELKEKVTRIEELLTQGASDAELRVAVEEVLPEIRQSVADLDALQTKPATPPVAG